MSKERLEYLTKLVNSKYYFDRKEAAQALDLPLELQEILARDEDWGIRRELAINANVTDIQIQEILARDEDKDVRYRLAWNPSFTDRKLWELLRNDENGLVRNTIQYRIEEEKDRIKAEFKEKINKC